MPENDDKHLAAEESNSLHKMAVEKGKNSWWALDGIFPHYTLVRCLICDQFIGNWDNEKNECKELNIHMRKHLKLKAFL
jgi:hypothetical protein